MVATRVEGKLGETPVKGTRILGACLGGDAVRVDGDADGRSTRAENEVVGTAPGVSQGPPRRYTKDAEAGGCARGVVDYVTWRDRDNEHCIKASASAIVSSHSYDRGGEGQTERRERQDERLERA